MNQAELAKRALDQGEGIVRLAPNWVPRSFCIPGRRIKLHPDDYYVLGGERGGIDERWFSSTTPADNGPLTGEHEGLSFIVVEDGSREQQVLLRDAVSELKGELIGDRLPGVVIAHTPARRLAYGVDPFRSRQQAVQHPGQIAGVAGRRSRPQRLVGAAVLLGEELRHLLTTVGR